MRKFKHAVGLVVAWLMLIEIVFDTLLVMIVRAMVGHDDRGIQRVIHALGLYVYWIDDKLTHWFDLGESWLLQELHDRR